MNGKNNPLSINPNGDMPQVDPTAFIDPAARVIGNVRIGANVYVGPYAVIRADETGADGKTSPIIIEAESNVQDGVIIHALGGTEVRIGKRTSLAHGCVVHGPCAIGDKCFVGFKAVVYNSTLADGTFISTSATIQYSNLAENSLVAPAKAILSEQDASDYAEKTSDKETEFMQKVITANLKLVKGYSSS